MTDDTNEGRKTDAATNEGRSLTVSRVIEAPPDRVYNAFLDPDELAEWLPPTGFSAEVHELEPEEGGRFRITFTAESEELEPYSHSFHGTYLELTPGERIVNTDEFETDDPGMAGEMLVTITFEEVPGGTEVTFDAFALVAVPLDVTDPVVVLEWVVVFAAHEKRDVVVVCEQLRDRVPTDEPRAADEQCRIHRSL